MGSEIFSRAVPSFHGFKTEIFHGLAHFFHGEKKKHWIYLPNYRIFLYFVETGIHGLRILFKKDALESIPHDKVNK